MLKNKIADKYAVILRLAQAEQEALEDGKPDAVALYRQAREKAEAEYRELVSRRDTIKVSVESGHRREDAEKQYR